MLLLRLGHILLFKVNIQVLCCVTNTRHILDNLTKASLNYLNHPIRFTQNSVGGTSGASGRHFNMNFQ